jgi:hypothetical protein
MQGSLPAGGLRLYREGVEPSGTRWKVSDYIVLLSRASPVASWMVLNGAITAQRLIDFMARLVRDADGKVFLILDRLRVHRAHLVQDWLADRQTQIAVFYLPAYFDKITILATFPLRSVPLCVASGSGIRWRRVCGSGAG